MSPGQEHEEGQEGASSTAVLLPPEPHVTSMAVWDVPSPIAFGAEVKVKVGVKCHSGCMLKGARVEVCDSRDQRVAEGRLGGLPLEGTTSLCWVEVAFKGPDMAGYHEWTARVLEAETEGPHKAASYKFATMTADPALHMLIVNVVDSFTKAPLDNAYVRIGAYTRFTDKSGAARATVPNAKSELVVWKRNYKMSRSTIDVNKDDSVRVELLQSPCKYCPDST